MRIQMNIMMILKTAMVIKIVMKSIQIVNFMMLKYK